LAGDEKIVLEEGRYCWHLSPATEYHGVKWVLHETGECVVAVVSLPFELAALALTLPVVAGCFVLFLPAMCLGALL
jgi:hypothetical protein